jgi:hypothetical protein
LTPQMSAALILAAWTAVPSAILVALATWSQTDSLKLIIIAGVTALVTPFATRGAGEGAFDSHREAVGDVEASDVGAHSPPLPREPMRPLG